MPATHRIDHEDDNPHQGRKQKTANGSKVQSKPSNPRNNPYLAHMYESNGKLESDAQAEEQAYSSGESDEFGNGVPLPKDINRARLSISTSKGPAKGPEQASDAPLANFRRHNTNTAMAQKAESGPQNPFTGTLLSKEYFQILKTRRNLPVHAQR